MKLNFNWDSDGHYHEYCLKCHAETIERQVENGQAVKHCRTCGQSSERSIIIDPAVEFWVAEDDEYWHESAGIFVRNDKGQFLLFERTLFPVGLMTVPAGHVDAHEEPSVSARRELAEETGLTASNLFEFATDDVQGDSCRRGSDAHRWHAFLTEVNGTPEIKLDADEGSKAVWLTLEQAMSKPLTAPVKYMFEHYKDKLSRPEQS